MKAHWGIYLGNHIKLNENVIHYVLEFYNYMCYLITAGIQNFISQLSDVILEMTQIQVGVAGNDCKVQVTDSLALALAAILNWAEEIPFNRRALLEN